MKGGMDGGVAFYREREGGRCGILKGGREGWKEG